MINRNHKDTITIWRTAVTGIGKAYSNPEKVMGRWENNRTLFRNETGDELVSRSIVYLSVDIYEGDFLMLGESNDADPSLLSDAFPVRAFYKTPDLRRNEYERKAYL